jgi:hypothetical protein
MLRFCVDFCLVLERNLLFLRWLVDIEDEDDDEYEAK